MESYGLEMDLFDDQADITEDLAQVEHGDINDIEMTGAGDDQHNPDENTGDGDLSRQVADKLNRLKQGAAKRRVLRPQPKMDPTRLCGERGMPILPERFQGVKFQGNGHEENDLFKLLDTYEHWAHRLFPKMPFEEMIERIERLGQKRQVQTTLSKLRQGMPVLEADFVSLVVSDDEEQSGEVQAQFSNPLDDLLPREDFEQPLRHPFADEEENLNDLMEESGIETACNSRLGQAHYLATSTPFHKGASNSRVDSDPARTDRLEKENQEPEPSEEVLERIRRNRELALQKLKAQQSLSNVI